MFDFAKQLPIAADLFGFRAELSKWRADFGEK